MNIHPPPPPPPINALATVLLSCYRSSVIKRLTTSNPEISNSNWGGNLRNELVLYVKNSEKQTNNNVKKARILRLCLRNCK